MDFEKTNMNIELEKTSVNNVKKYLNIIRKKWIFIFAITILAALIGFLYAKKSYKEPVITYEATATIMIGDPHYSENKYEQMNSLLSFQRLVKFYTELGRKQIVLNDIIKNLNLKYTYEALLSKAWIISSNDSNFLIIKSKSNDADEAGKIANQFSKSLINISLEINKLDVLKIIEEAQVSKIITQSKKNYNFQISVSAVFGFTISIFLIFVREYMNTSIKDENELENILNAPVLGTIPKFNYKN